MDLPPIAPEDIAADRAAQVGAGTLPPIDPADMIDPVGPSLRAKPAQSRNVVEDVGAGALAGVYDTLKGTVVSPVIAGLDVVGAIDGTKATDFIRTVEGFAPTLRPSKEAEESYFRRSLYGGARSASRNISTMYLGARFGKMAGVKNPLLTTAPMVTYVSYGADAYNDFVAEAIEQKVDPVTARAVGVAAGFLEGGVEAVSSRIEAALAGLTKVGGGRLSDAATESLRRKLTRYAKEYGKMYGVEQIEEGVQGEGSELLKGSVGMEQKEFGQATKEGMGATAFASLFLFGGGKYARYAAEKANKSDLRDMGVPESTITEILGSKDPDKAKELFNSWRTETMRGELRKMGVPPELVEEIATAATPEQREQIYGQWRAEVETKVREAAKTFETDKELIAQQMEADGASPQDIQNVRGAIHPVDLMQRLSGYQITKLVESGIPKALAEQIVVAEQRGDQQTSRRLMEKADTDLAKGRRRADIKDQTIRRGLDPAMTTMGDAPGYTLDQVQGSRPGQPAAAPPATPTAAPPAAGLDPNAAAAPAPGATTASVPLMVTKAMKADLATLGYTPEQIARMRPETANQIIADRARPTAQPPIIGKTEEATVQGLEDQAESSNIPDELKPFTEWTQINGDGFQGYFAGKTGKVELPERMINEFLRAYRMKKPGRYDGLISDEKVGETEVVGEDGIVYQYRSGRDWAGRAGVTHIRVKPPAPPAKKPAPAPPAVPPAPGLDATAAQNSKSSDKNKAARISRNLSEIEAVPSEGEPSKDHVMLAARMVNRYQNEAGPEAEKIIRRAKGIIRRAEKNGYEVRIPEVGSRFDVGLPHKVIAYEQTDGIDQEQIGEVIFPAVWRNGKIEQRAEVVVYTPKSEATNKSLDATAAPDPAAIAAAANEAATSPANDRPEPTEAQKEAGNYKKGKVKAHGFDISIENPAGSKRDPKWKALKDHYGYIRRTEGHDGDHIDVFINVNRPQSETVFVIDQVDPKTGKFDEHKVVFGAVNEREATDIYERNYQKGWKGLGSIRAMTPDEFRAWANSDAPKKQRKVEKPKGLDPTAPVVQESSTPDPTVKKSLTVEPPPPPTIKEAPDAPEKEVQAEAETAPAVGADIIPLRSVYGRRYYTTRRQFEDSGPDVIDVFEKKSDAGDLTKRKRFYRSDIIETRTAGGRGESGEKRVALYKVLDEQGRLPDRQPGGGKNEKTELKKLNDAWKKGFRPYSADADGNPVPAWKEIEGGKFQLTDPSPVWAKQFPKVGPKAKAIKQKVAAKKETGVVETIAGKMSLTEFEAKGYAPEQVTKQDWINLQRAERRRLGQAEEGDNRNAPWAEYEEFHKQAVTAAVKKGDDVDPEVLKDYPDLQLPSMRGRDEREDPGSAPLGTVRDLVTAKGVALKETFTEQDGGVRFELWSNDKEAVFRQWDIDSRNLITTAVGKPDVIENMYRRNVNRFKADKAPADPAPKPDAKPKPPKSSGITMNKPPPGGWTERDKVRKLVGKNESGEEVRVDSNGARSIVRDDVLITQPARVIPGRAGMSKDFASPEMLFSQGRTEFLTAEEVATFQEDAGDVAEAIQFLRTSGLMRDTSPIEGQPSGTLEPDRKTRSAIKTVNDAVQSGEYKADDIPADVIDWFYNSTFAKGKADKVRLDARFKASDIEQDLAAGRDVPIKEVADHYASRFGNVLNTDSVKLLFVKAGYKPTDVESVRKYHPQAAKLTGEIFDHWIKTRKNQGDGVVVFVGGGNGSGKSTISGDYSTHAFVMDSTMGTRDIIEAGVQKAVDAGYPIYLVFVYRDPIQAWTGIKNRVEEGGHPTPASVFARNHANARGNFQYLVDKYGGKADIHIVENITGQGAVPLTLRQLADKPVMTQREILDQINESTDRKTKRELGEVESGGTPLPGRSGTETPGQTDRQEVAPLTTAEEDAAYQANLARMRKLLSGRGGKLTSGIDPEILTVGTELAGYHIKRGVRAFREFARAMRRDLADLWGNLRPDLRAIWEGAAARNPDIEEVSRAQAATILDEVDAESASQTDPESVQKDQENDDEQDTDAGGNAGATRQPRQRRGAEEPGTDRPDSLGTPPPEDGRGDDQGGDAGSADQGGRGVDPADDGADGEVGDAPMGGVGGSPRAGNPTARRSRGGGARGRRGAGNAGTVRDRRGGPDPDAETGGSPVANYRIKDDEGIGEGGEAAKFDDNIEAIKAVARIEQSGRQATPEEQKLLVRYVGWGGLSKVFDRRFDNWREIKKADESGDDPPYFARYYRDEYEKEKNDPWFKRYLALRDLMTDEEFDAARASTINAHYTAIPVIDALYDGLSHLGFKGGRMLETSAGIGHFLGRQPNYENRTQWTAIELDPFTGKILKALYPRADVRVQGFQEAALADDYYDVITSNVPFADVRPYDAQFKKYRFVLHDYFFAKSLKKLRPGGVMAFITSNGTMDKINTTLRDYLQANGAQFIGAVRLPNDAFKKNAGTQVVTDIIYFKRVAPGTTVDNSAMMEAKTVTVDDVELEINGYFVDHPEMVLGKISSEGSMYRANTMTVESTGGDLAAKIREAVRRLPAGMYEDRGPTAKTSKKPTESEPEYAPGDVKEGNIGLNSKGEAVVKRNGVWEPLAGAGPAKLVNLVVKYAVPLRTAARRVIAESQRGDAGAEVAIKSAQKELNKAYDTFVKHVGIIHAPKNKKVLKNDIDFPLLIALEKYDSDTKTASKTEFFTARVISPPSKVEKSDSIEDALNVSINETNAIDIDRIASLIGMPRDTTETMLVEQGLIYRNPTTDAYETAEEYLSGFVRQKLREARAALPIDPSMQRNVEALEKVIPPDLETKDIKPQIGSPWIEPSDWADFLQHLVGGDAEHWKVSHSVLNGDWNITHIGNKWQAESAKYGSRATQVWGTRERPAHEIVASLMTGKALRVMESIGDGKSVLNKEATALVEEKAEAIRNEFEKWIWSDEARTERLMRKYNDTYNDTAEWVFSQAAMPLVNISPMWQERINEQDRGYRRAAIRRVIRSGNTLLAHAVGAGKTSIIAVSAMELRRMGLAKKPMLVVPNHMISQWAGEFIQIYPNAKLLVGYKEDLATDRRKEFLARIATGNYDAVIIAHSAYGKIDMSKGYKQEYIQQEIAAVEDAILAARAEEREAEEQSDGRNRGKDTRLVKQLEKTKQRYEEKLKKMMAEEKKDKHITFDELGIDYLFVDEAHNFKGLAINTKRARVPGIQQQTSQKAQNMEMKTRYVNRLHGGSRGVVFATGTPISNSISEMYVMMRYMAPEVLKAKGIFAFDDWVNMFGSIVTDTEIHPTGRGFRSKERFSSFNNMGEMQQVFRAFTDVVLSKDLKIKRPELKDGRINIVKATPSEWLDEYIESLLKRAEAVAGGNVDPRKDNMLVITSDGRKAAMDPRMIDPGQPDLPGSKVNLAVENIFRVWKESKGDKAAQIVFSDLGIPKKRAGQRKATKAAEDTDAIDAEEVDPNSDTAGIDALNATDFDVYNDIKRKLVARGVPASEVAFIHDAETDDAKGDLFAKVRSGKVRVIIGNTAKMGEGTNIQERLIAIHHLDVPWKPAWYEQRNGRIFRAGNQFDEVYQFNYVTERSFDAYMWQTIERKAGFIDQALTADRNTRSIEDVESVALTAQEMKAIASGNPVIIEKANLEIQLRKLEKRRSAAELQKSRSSGSMDSYRRKIAFEKDWTAKLEKVKSIYDARPEKAVITIGKTTYSDPSEIAAAITKEAQSEYFKDAIERRKDVDAVIGSYLGMSVQLRVSVYTGDAKFEIRVMSGSYVSGGSSLNYRKNEKSEPVFTYEEGSPTVTALLNMQLGRLNNQIDASRQEAKTAEQQLEVLLKTSAPDFDQQAEVDRITARLFEIEKELGINQQDAAAAALDADEAIDTDGAGADQDVSMSVRSSGPVTPEMDAAYMAAVDRGDTATARRLVDEAAKAAGYTVRAYHGTDQAISVFATGELTHTGYAHFADKRKVAEGFAELVSEVSGGNPVVYEVFLKKGTRTKPGIDFGGNFTEYLVSNPRQVKSADPVTRDDKGNVIPLSQRFNPESADIRMSSRPPVDGSTVAEVQGWVGPILSRLARPEAVAVVANADGIADGADRAMVLGAFRRQFQSVRSPLGRELNPPEVSGVRLPNGRIYLFSDQLRDADEAGRVLVEEIAHNGFNHIPFSEIERILDAAYGANAMMRNRAYAAATREVERNYPGLNRKTEANKRMFYNEVLAHIAANRGKQPNIWNRLVDAVRRFLAGLLKGTTLGDRFAEQASIPAVEALIDAMLASQTRDGATVDAGMVAFSRSGTPAPTWYSQLQRVIEAKMPNRATVANLRGIIDPAKGSGIKAEEIEWTGLGDWLDSKKPLDKITKEEVLATLKPVEVRDVVLGKNSRDESIRQEFDRNFAGQDVADIIDSLVSNNMLDEEDIPEGADYATLREMAPRFADPSGAADDFFDGSGKFEAYQLPGGKNYRELLLTLPEDSNQERRDELGAMWERGKIKEGTPLYEEYARVSQVGKTYGPFNSSHFNQPNIIVHVRFNERTDADGRRVMFVEEIQSDWHQAGRKKGYESGDRNRRLFDAARRFYREIWTPLQRGQMTSQDADKQFSALSEQTGFTRDEIQDEGARRGDFTNMYVDPGVPNAPFKNNAWAKLAMKRMIRLAAERGFDAVAWTTGTQQADRYDLGQQVDRIDATKDKDGVYSILAIKEGRVLVDRFDLSAEQLPELVGKDLAEKIVAMPVDPNKDFAQESFTGLDLKVGGKGMKDFYDKILVNIGNEIGKKFGARVGRTNLVGVKDPVNMEYQGPDLTAEEMLSIGRNLDARLTEQSRGVAAAMKLGASFKEAMEREGSIGLAREAGGELVEIDTAPTVHTLPLTESLVDSVLFDGQPLFSVRRRPDDQPGRVVYKGKVYTLLRTPSDPGKVNLLDEATGETLTVSRRATKPAPDDDAPPTPPAKDKPPTPPAPPRPSGPTERLRAAARKNRQAAAEAALRETAADQEQTAADIAASFAALQAEMAALQASVPKAMELAAMATERAIYKRKNIPSEREDELKAQRDAWKAKIPARTVRMAIQFAYEKRALRMKNQSQRAIKNLMEADIEALRTMRENIAADPDNHDRYIDDAMRAIFEPYDYAQIKKLYDPDANAEAKRKHGGSRSKLVLAELEKFFDIRLSRYYSQKLVYDLARTDFVEAKLHPDVRDDFRRLITDAPYTYIEKLKEQRKKLKFMRSKVSGRSPEDIEAMQDSVDKDIQRVAELFRESGGWEVLKGWHDRTAEIWATSQRLQYMIRSGIKVERETVSREIAAEIIASAPPLKGTEDTRGRRTRGITEGKLTDLRLNQMTRALQLGNGREDSVAFDVLGSKIEDAETRMLSLQREILGVGLEAKQKELGITENLWATWSSDLKWYTLNGQRIKLTTAEIMDLMATIQDPQNLAELAYAPLKLRRLNGQPVGVKFKTAAEAKDAIDELIDQNLSANQKEMVLWMVDTLTAMGDGGNRVSRHLFGQDLFTNPRYWPRERDITGRATGDVLGDINDLKRSKDRSLEGLGLTKERVANKRGLMLSNVLLKFSGHVHKMSAYTHMTIPVGDALAALKHATNQPDDPGVGEAIRVRYGSDYLRTMNQLYQRAAGLRRYSDDWTGMQRAMAWVERHASVAILWGRISTIIFNRWGGSLLAMGELAQRHPGKAAAYLKYLGLPSKAFWLSKANREARADLMENGYLWRRWANDFVHVQANLPIDDIEAQVDKARILHRKIQELGMRPMAEAEMKNAIAVYRVLREAGISKTTALREVEKITRATQNPSSPMQESVVYEQLKKSGLGVVFPFMGQPTVASTLLARDVLKLKAARKTKEKPAIKKARRALVLTAYGLIGNLILTSAVRALLRGAAKGEWPWEDDQNMLYTMMNLLTEGMDLLMPGSGKLVDSAVGLWRRGAARDTSMIGRIAESFAGGMKDLLTLVDDDPDNDRLGRGMHRLAEAISLTTGLPYSGPATTVKVAAGIATAGPLPREELIKEASKAFYVTEGKRVDGTRYRPGDPRPGKEKDAAKLLADWEDGYGSKTILLAEIRRFRNR